MRIFCCLMPFVGAPPPAWPACLPACPPCPCLPCCGVLPAFARATIQIFACWQLGVYWERSSSDGHPQAWSNSGEGSGGHVEGLRDLCLVIQHVEHSFETNYENKRKKHGCSCVVAVDQFDHDPPPNSVGRVLGWHHSTFVFSSCVSLCRAHAGRPRRSLR